MCVVMKYRKYKTNNNNTSNYYYYYHHYNNNSKENNYYAWLFNLLLVTLLIQQHVLVVHATVDVTNHVTGGGGGSVALAKGAGIIAVNRNQRSFATTPQHKHAKRDITAQQQAALEKTGNVAAADEDDFVAYINDFNMQDETSIPEDIFDQQHIQDGYSIDADIQYGGDAVGGGGSSEAADIILESEGFSTKRSNTYESNSNSENNNNYSIKRKTNNRKNHYNKFKNKNDTVENGNKANNNNDNVDVGAERRTIGGDGNADSEANDGNIVTQETSAAYDADESFINKKFKSIVHEQQNQQQQQQQQYQNKQQEVDEENVDKQQQQEYKLQQMETTEKLNERKFNKMSATQQYMANDNIESNDSSSSSSNSNKQNNNNNNNNNKNSNKNNRNKMHSKDIVTNTYDTQDHNDDGDDQNPTDGDDDDIAIGDIDDVEKKKTNNFRYIGHEKIALDIDKSDDDFTTTPPTTTTTTLAIPIRAASSNVDGSSNNKNNNNNNNHRMNFIPRKHKRYFTGKNVNTDDLRNFERMPPHKTHHQHHYNDNNNYSGNNKHSNNNHNNNHKEDKQNDDEMMHREQEETDYAANYFGILANDSNTATTKMSVESAITTTTSSDGAGSYYNDGHLRQQPFTEYKKYDMNANKSGYNNDDADEATEEVAEAAESSALSAFEKYKAERRNNRHNGHKSHKKKYKDYLRYAMTGTTTPTTTTTTAAIEKLENIVNGGEVINATILKWTNAETDDESKNQKKKTLLKPSKNTNKYAQKLAAEKSYGLPASPIFVVAPRKHAITTAISEEKSNNNNNYSNGKDSSESEDKENNKNNDEITENERVQQQQQQQEQQQQHYTTKPFYEGQINYYIETKDEGDLRHKQQQQDIDRIITGDQNSNWYRRVSPVLRNGIKMQEQQIQQPTPHEPQKSHRIHQQQQHQQHKHKHTHLTHHKHQQHNPHHKYQRNSYQRKAHANYAKHPISSSHHLTHHHAASSHKHAVQTPLPPPAYNKQLQQQNQNEKLRASSAHAGAMQELGHQITEMEDFERYYAKWPHLARVQFQVYDEHYRESHPELYPEYDDYESTAELEEAQNADDEEANLPPYIKKYNRRNKQLLNLLEGTLAPPQPMPTRRSTWRSTWSTSQLQPGPHDSSSSSSRSFVHLDDEYLKEKRGRNHYNHQHYHDLFAQQRNNGHEHEKTPQANTTAKNNKSSETITTTVGSLVATNALDENQLPDEDVSISLEQDNDATAVMAVEAAAGAEDDDAEKFWQKEIELKSNVNAKNAGVNDDDDNDVAEITGSKQITSKIEKLIATTTTTTPKAALYKLPSYPAIAGSFIGKPRSRSAQYFAAPNNNAGGGSSSSSSRISSAGNGLYKARVASSDGFTNTITNANAYKAAMKHYRKDDYNAHDGDNDDSVHIATSTIIVDTGTGEAMGRGTDAQAEENTDTAATNTNSKALNSFVYHRVMDASPRLVGAGATGRKQRLPFVAITDRRLETSKKILLERQKDFEQNHYPMP